MKYSCFIIILILLTLIVACKATVKGETHKFDQNQQKIIRLMNIYPRYKAYLEDLAQRAKKIFAESDALPDEEARIKKMAEANKAVGSDKMFNQLNNYERILESVNSKMSELRSITEQKYMSAIREILDNSRYRLEEAEDVLRYSRPQSYNDALRDIDKAYDIVLQTETILKDTIDAINEDRNKATPDTSINNPQIDTDQDSGGRTTTDTNSSDSGSREGSRTEEVDDGGR